MSASDETLKKWKSRAVASPTIHPVWVFHGEEEFLRSELLAQAPDLFVPDEPTRSFNCDVLYGAETSMEQVITVARSYPMMAERRLVVVREAERILRAKPAGAPAKGRKKQNDDPLLNYLLQPNPSTVLIFDLDKFGARNQSPFRELNEKAQVVEFPMMKEGEAAEWVRARAKAMGNTLPSDAARLMTAYLGTSLRSLANELEKLIIYAGDRKDISSKDVEQVVGASRENNVFELTKAIGAGNKPLAAEITLRMLDQDKDQRQFLFVMLNRFIEQLTIARELAAKGENERAIADALELRGGAAYFAKEIIGQARRYTREKLDAALRALVEAEAQTRGKQHSNDELLMETLLVGIMP
ncbi:MAG: DNA polymerase III subunit delta [Candidatus Kapaibacterium sp.]